MLALAEMGVVKERLMAIDSNTPSIVTTTTAMNLFEIFMVSLLISTRILEMSLPEWKYRTGPFSPGG
jgi:hypothetical protein